MMVMKDKGRSGSSYFNKISPSLALSFAKESVTWYDEGAARLLFPTQGLAMLSSCLHYGTNR